MSKPFDPVKFAAGVHDYIAKALAPLVARVKALEERETKTLADHFRGPWLPGEYKRGDLVQHRGSAWLCIETGTGKPGESSHWRLIVK
jgi:hypothetical protein